MSILSVSRRKPLLSSKKPYIRLLSLIITALFLFSSGTASYTAENTQAQYALALDLLYTRQFEKAHDAFLSLEDYADSSRLAAFSVSYPASEPEAFSPLISENRISRRYEHGILYSHPSGMFYIPNEVNTRTSFVLYYCGGDREEDYIYYSGLYNYFNNYFPNAILFFCNESGYNHMAEKNEQMYQVLQLLAYECGTIVHDLSTIGSSVGCYTALKAAAQFYMDYRQIVNNVCTLDTGLYWRDDMHNLTKEECDKVAEAGTVFFLFEEPDVGIEVPAIRMMVDHGIQVYVIGCKHHNHSVISQLAYTYGVFSWSAGEDIYLSEEEYSIIRLTAD